jgi:hypothetical protein
MVLALPMNANRLSMETVKNIASAVIVIGGLGAFIDFLIGRSGQERAKDFLLKWWVRFDDVHWQNFGREEGLFAYRLIPRVFGRRIWSLRRVVAFFVLLMTLFVFSVFDSKFYISCHYCNNKFFYGTIAIGISFCSFSVSVIYTRFLTALMIRLCDTSRIRNLIVFVTMLMANLLILRTWSPMTEINRKIILYIIEFSTLHDIDIQSVDQIRGSPVLTQQFSTTDSIAIFSLPYVPSLFRVILSIVFVGSFLLRPLVMRPLSLVWARIIESDKPVFTLTFGGAAAFASAISEAAKHL